MTLRYSYSNSSSLMYSSHNGDNSGYNNTHRLISNSSRGHLAL